MEYVELKNTPEELKDLGVKAVYVPRQDGYRGHYALLRTEDDMSLFACSVWIF